ncbi:cysteine hydrolase family protein [uncultured Vagococcus sp.]|uniref:cysteine hydrolase family protein n=1 Tax=uncultured Vagococcus sp. TaxID=189676 RepID=UPI0028D23E41|nr:cysteine hydrolase family protein [uncultured Vagococcus sp.]
MANCLIIIDLQRGLHTETAPLYQLDKVLRIANERITDYRKKNLPIIFIQHKDQELVPATDPWKLMKQLDNRGSDYYIEKTHANSFYRTSLSNLLTELAVKEIEFCGAQTEYCVDTTIRVAHSLGYTLSMIRGSTTTLDSQELTAEQIINHHEAIWNQRFLTFI